MAFTTAFLVFLATFTLAAVAVWIARMFLGGEGEDGEAGETSLSSASLAGYREEVPALLRETELSSITLWARVLERLNLAVQLKRAIAQADLNWTVGRISTAMLLLATLALAVGNQMSWVPLWATLGLAVVAGFSPYFYILHLKDKRWEKIEEQFPDALESMARALRAGYPFGAALDNAANQAREPLGKELRRTFAEGAFGAPWDQALMNFADRIPLQEVCLFAAAVQMQSKAGGNLSEVLEKLSENMREAAALKGEVRSYSGQGRMAGYILSTLPVAITALLYYVNPSFLTPLFTDDIGKKMLTGAVAGLVTAHFVIRKLVDIRL